MRHDQTARAVLARLSKTGLGCSLSVVTPTTLVGTRVIKGGDSNAITAAIAKQRDWNPAQ